MSIHISYKHWTNALLMKVHSLVTVPCFSFYLMARFYSKTIQDTTLPAIGISPWVPINCDNFWLFLFLVTLIDLRSTGQVYFRIPLYLCFPGGASGKESACSAGDLGSIPELWRSPGEGNGTPLQRSCLGNPIDGGTRWVTVQRGVTKSQTQWSMHTHAPLCENFSCN